VIPGAKIMKKNNIQVILEKKLSKIDKNAVKITQNHRQTAKAPAIRSRGASGLKKHAQKTRRPSPPTK
jgi:hypothetical protein